MPTTNKNIFVSAFYDIGRSTWDDVFRCTNDVYTQYIDDLIRICQEIVIYLDAPLYEKYRQKYGDKIQPYDPNDTFIPATLAKESKIMQLESYKQRLQHRIHHPEHCRPIYNAVNHNKVYFLKRTQESKPGYSHYTWVDIHYFRHGDIPSPSLLNDPNNIKTTHEIIIGTSKYPEQLEHIGSPIDIMQQTEDHIQGSVFIVPHALVSTLYKMYTEQLEINYGLEVCDDDQGIHLAIYKRMPQLYDLMYTTHFGNFFTVYESYQLSHPPLKALNRLNINFTKNTKLCDIMTEERSDKGNGWHNYTMVYNVLFQGICKKPVSLFEMGLGSCNPNIPSNMGENGRPGASLYGWSRYFTNPSSICWGADIDPTIQISSEKIRTFFCNQLDPASLRNMWTRNPYLHDKLFDIIIDDGLHTFTANRTMFENSFYKLRAGGVYIIESIHNDYHNSYNQYIQSLQHWLPGAAIHFARIPNQQNTADNTCLFIQKRFRSDFMTHFTRNMHHFKALGDIMAKTFNSWRGIGSYLINGQSLDYEPVMRPKQENLFEYAKQATRALEIGVHGGHSLFIMLLANPTIKIDAIDLCLWEHTEKCVEYLNSQFQNRITLYKGDSLASIHLISPNKYDLVHIDGDHHEHYVRQEFNLLKPTFTKDTNIVFDDIEAPNVFDFVINNDEIVVLDIPECRWPNCIAAYKGDTVMVTPPRQPVKRNKIL